MQWTALSISVQKFWPKIFVVLIMRSLNTKMNKIFRVAWRSKCQGKDLSSYSSDCTKLIAKQVPNAIEEPQSPTSQYAFTLNEDSQTYENIANSNDTPMSLKDIVLSQGGKDLQSLWQKFFGTKK